MRQHRASAFAWPLLALVPLLTAAVVLGGGFGEASASGRQVSAARIEVDLTVEATDVEAVVAHVIEPGAQQETIPLVDRGGGVYGIIIELRKADYVVVFETFASGVSNQSQPLRLTELGLNPALIGVLPFPTTTSPEYSSDTRMWGWAGLALAALALAFLAWWALPDRAAPPPHEPEPEPVDPEPVDPEPVDPEPVDPGP